jgi:sec-independent protein translocase protein TatB
MFELDWAKLLIIMVVAIVVVGPKELPGLLKMLGRTLAVLRRHAEQFRVQFEQSMQELTKDVGVDDIKDDLRALNELNPANQIRNTLDQAMRGVPTPQNYLRGEPAPGAAAAAFAEPQPTDRQQEGAPPPHEAEAQLQLHEPQLAASEPTHDEPGAPAEKKENKESLEPAAVH